MYAASEGLRTLVLEPEAVGGQAGTSSLIRNYPGFQNGISGNRLAFSALQQAWAFGSTFHFMRSGSGRSPPRTACSASTLSDGTSVRQSAPWSSPPAPRGGGSACRNWRR